MELNTVNVFGLFPKGVILAWYAKSGEFPPGWAVCDGTNGTPDLRQRFLMGVTDLADVGFPDGKNIISDWKTVEHTLTVQQIPSHSHGQQVRPHDGPPGVIQNYEYSPNFPNGVDNNWSWRGSDTSATGGTQSHVHDLPTLDNRPKFDTVIFLMKL